MPEETNILEQFVDDLCVASGIGDLPEDLLEEEKNKLAFEVQKRLGAEIVHYLSDDDLAEYEKMLTQDLIPPAELLHFFETRVPNFKIVVESILQNITKDFLKN